MATRYSIILQYGLRMPLAITLSAAYDIFYTIQFKIRIRCNWELTRHSFALVWYKRVAFYFIHFICSLYNTKLLGKRRVEHSDHLPQFLTNIQVFFQVDFFFFCSKRMFFCKPTMRYDTGVNCASK